MTKLLLFLSVFLPTAAQAEWVAICGTKNQSGAKFFLERQTRARASADVLSQCRASSPGQRCASPLCTRIHQPDIPKEPAQDSDPDCRWPWFRRHGDCITVDRKIVAEAFRRKRARQLRDWIQKGGKWPPSR